MMCPSPRRPRNAGATLRLSRRRRHEFAFPAFRICRVAKHTSIGLCQRLQRQDGRPPRRSQLPVLALVGFVCVFVHVSVQRLHVHELHHSARPFKRHISRRRQKTRRRPEQLALQCVAGWRPRCTLASPHSCPDPPHPSANFNFVRPVTEGLFKTFASLCVRLIPRPARSAPGLLPGGDVPGQPQLGRDGVGPLLQRPWGMAAVPRRHPRRLRHRTGPVPTQP